MEKLLHTPEGVRDIYNMECRKKLALEEQLHKILRLHGYHDIPDALHLNFLMYSAKKSGLSVKRIIQIFR